VQKLAAAVELAPGDPISRYNYGVALLLANRVDSGIAQLQKSLDLNPRQADAYYYLGRAWMLKNDWNAAVAALEQALSLSPSDQQAQTALATVRKHTATSH
jgi:predicted Zn-dependent protease